MSFITYTHHNDGPGFEVRHLVVNGRLGDCRSVGEGVWEMRVHFGPGYRIYFAREAKRLILILCGGNKAVQRRDIENAKEAWRRYRTKA